MGEPEVWVVSTTVDSQAAAEALARSAVAARVAACAHVGAPVSSVYWWQAAIQDAQEWLVTFKTCADRYPELEQHLCAAHPYQVPEIICNPVVAGHTPYLTWVREQTRPVSAA